jgi:hypothetical protein
MSPIKELVIISSPRNGTNFFCECVDALDAAKSYFELLNSNGVMGVGDPATLRALNTAFGTQADGPRDVDLMRSFQADPLTGIGVLRDHVSAHGKSLLAYKIFPGQASLATMEKIINRENVIVAQIVRRRLDVFISYKKALTKNVWKNESTKDILIEIDIDEFLKWADKIDKWFANTGALITQHNRPNKVWVYEDDINRPKADVIFEIQNVLAQNGLNLDITLAIKKEKFSRQDRQVGPFKKIDNGEKLRQELRARGKYNYALSAPLTN